ncbi:MAG: bifunctional diguanylate cyclase/phosphodiesterase [Campylobacterota bacterium]|nr:bifunctional diguanylate cyclase/phosphodiesterase [Campylobacterota bacterium]
MIEEKSLKLKEQYVTDYLTHLPNKVYLDQLISSTDEAQTIILLNIDNFRLINQNLSYYIGDKILLKVAQKLQEFRPPVFELCRLQGDEFVFLANGDYLQEAQELVQAIKKEFKTHPIDVGEIELDITFTIAIDYGIHDDLLKSVSTMIQALKESGKNRVGIQEYNSRFKQEQQQNLYWIKMVKECLKKSQVEVFFQPIKEIATNQITKYEALARIILEDNEIIMPRSFIKPAILAGVGTEITKVVIDKGMKKFKNRTLKLSFNITQDDLREGYLAEYLQHKCQQYGIEHSQVILEILESISVDEEENYIEQLDNLKKLGYQIAIDDFGTEMSNFSRLLRLDPDYIKIDGSFIKNIDHDKNSFEIVSTIISFAHKIGSKVIAEFVHSQLVCDKVRALEIDYVQGYHIGEPSSKIIE